jgi:AcrR family transcriptional regulator
MTPLPKHPEKAQLILHAALKVFSEKGIEKGTIAEIAKEAGLGKGTVYQYYNSKADIYFAIEVSKAETWDLLFQTTMAKPISCSQKLELLISEGVAQTIHAGDAILVIFEIWSHTIRGLVDENSFSPMTIMYEKFHSELVALLEQGIAKGEFREMQPSGVATMIIAFMDGISIQMLMLKDQFEKNNWVEQSIQSLLNGLISKPSKDKEIQ